MNRKKMSREGEKERREKREKKRSLLLLSPSLLRAFAVQFPLRLCGPPRFQGIWTMGNAG
jgi:hypothetical protein